MEGDCRPQCRSRGCCFRLACALLPCSSFTFAAFDPVHSIGILPGCLPCTHYPSRHTIRAAAFPPTPAISGCTGTITNRNRPSAGVARHRTAIATGCARSNCRQRVHWCTGILHQIPALWSRRHLLTLAVPNTGASPIAWLLAVAVRQVGMC